MSVVIKGGTVVTADRTYRADVRIEGETIAAVGLDLSGDEVIDAGGAYIMPGGIDPHTHMEMPFMGTTATDNFDSGTGAALAGGTTTIVDFVLPSNGQSLMAALEDWDRKAKMARTDFSYHMAITYWGDSVRDEMEAVVKRGVTSFKHFMAYKGALMVDDDELYQSFCRVGDLGALALVHAENGDVVLRLQQKYMAEGLTGPEGHAYSRPPEVEGEATNRAIMVAGMAGTPLYIVHTSSIPAHEAIARARANGQRVFGEPLIQHLVLDDSEYQNKDWDHAAQRVMSPPFRDKKHQETLWNGLVSGSLQVVATDHCAFSTEQKRMGKDDFTKIPNGTGGLEDRMPVLWTHGVGTGRLTMNEFVAVTSTNSAKILNMYPRKGAIMPGADADLVIWDPEASKTISAATQKSAIDYNVFEGIAVKGLPAVTLSRGRIAYKDGQVQAKPGDGAFIPREPFTAATRALRHRFETVAPQPVDRWVP